MADDTAKCDDGSKCTKIDACKSGKCVGSGDGCQDGNPCTKDSCNAGQVCAHAATNEGGPCDDGNKCTTTASCQKGKCVGHGGGCDDANVCTKDSCKPDGSCVHVHQDGDCEDGNKCTNNDGCINKVCKSGPANVKCDDGLACTVDACDPLKGCVTAPNPNAYGPPCDGALRGNRCYKAFKAQKKWADAEAACKGWGGHLASIADSGENEHVRKLGASCYEGLGGSWFWIGGSDGASEGKWTWTDGTAMSWKNWSSGEPNDFAGQEDAACMNRGNGKWHDYIHWAPLWCYVCERPAPTACHDGSKCTKPGTCDQKGACKMAPVSCWDGNDCTKDACDAKTGCTHTKAPDGTKCAGGGTCSKGVCSVGGSDAPATSCQAIHKSNPGAKSGVYWLDPDGSGGVGKFRAYCDMSYAGGGWTLVMRIDGTKKTFGYWAGYWSNKSTYRADKPGFSDGEAKLASYHTVPFKHMRLGMKRGGDYRWLVVPYTASSLYAAIADGKHRATKVGRDKWKGLVKHSSLQKYCNREGFNAGGPGSFSRVRIGIVGNEQNSCSTPDSRVGFGGAGSSCGTKHDNTCGNTASKSCKGDNGSQDLRTFGWVFVR